MTRRFDLAALDTELVASPSVIVLRDRMVSAWPRSAGQGELVSVVDLASRAFDGDAHFVAYTTEPARRLSKDAYGRAVATFTTFVVDVDDPVAHDQHTPARDEWRDDLTARASALETWGYWTRGGARFVWQLAEPFEVRDEASADAFKARMRDSYVWLFAKCGIECDPACTDPQRLYRAPHATRDGAADCEARGWVCGAPWALGAWTWPRLGRGDELATLAQLSRKSKAWRGALNKALPPKPSAPYVPSTRTKIGDPIGYAVREVEGTQTHRNQKLHALASFLKRLADDGEISRTEAHNALERAGVSTGLPIAEVRKTLRNLRG